MLGTGADLIVSTLESLGVKHAFGIPGGPLSGLFTRLSNSRQIKVTLSQHETAAAYIAMGTYLFGNDRQAIPIVFATAGPGMLNLITGVASAMEERVPLFVLTANIALDLRGAGAVQDSYEGALNGIGMFDSLTAKNEILRRIEDADAVIRNLYETALHRSRPVHLNVPADVAHRELPHTKQGLFANFSSLQEQMEERP